MQFGIGLDMQGRWIAFGVVLSMLVALFVSGEQSFAVGLLPAP